MAVTDTAADMGTAGLDMDSVLDWVLGIRIGAMVMVTAILITAVTTTVTILITTRPLTTIRLRPWCRTTIISSLRPRLRPRFRTIRRRRLLVWAPAQSGQQIYLIAFKDHHIEAAIAYWVEADSLHYVTRQNERRQAPLDSIDRPFSEQINRDRHIDFRLPR